MSQSETDAGPDQGTEPRPDRWRILFVTLLIGFMALLDVTVVNVALPSIQQGLGASAATVQWIVSGYALAFGLVLVAGGRLGDIYGRRVMLLAGLAGFVLSSAAVGLAPNAELVVAARLLQGFSAGMLTPQSSGLIQEQFQGRERGIAFGYFGTTVSVASAAGPILGGLIIAAFGQENGWRLIFGINVPIGILAAVFVWLRVPRPQGKIARQHIDVIGALLLGASVLCLLLPTVQAENGLSAISFLVIGTPVFAVAFVWWERRERRLDKAPLLDIELLRGTPGYASGIAVGTVYFTGFTGIFLVLSVYLQDAAGMTALQTGLLLTPFAVGGAIMSPLAGRLVSRFQRKVTASALAVMLIGIAVLVLVLPDQPQHLSWLALSIPLLIAGLGAGAVVSPNQTLSLENVQPAMGGAAGAALQTGQRIGAALGSAVIVVVYRIGASSSGNPSTGLMMALSVSLVVLTFALILAIRDDRHR